tara:strand:+ start:2269 stop:3600 length:1332 start_codon:yes stop_codon:yes gene_type:complete
MPRAAWSEIDSTPALGLPLGGRGPRFSNGEEVLDPLVSQVVVLEDERGNRTVWVSIDMIGMTWQVTAPFRQELAALTGIPFDAIIVNYSHTHNGPMSGFEGYATIVEKPVELIEYEQNLLDRVSRMTLDAIDCLEPVTVSVHRGTSEIGINRRNRSETGEMGLRPNPQGHLNRDLWVLDLDAVKGNRRCVLFNYGCHPVTVYAYAWNGISPDWVGVGRQTLQCRLGENTHTQFIQGFAGNVRPRQVADLASNSFRKSTPDDTKAVGQAIGADVLAALDSEGDELDLDFAFAADFVMAPRDPDAIPPISHYRELAGSEEEIERNLGEYWVRRLESGVPPVKYVPWAVGLMRLAPGHTVAWLANEVVGEWLPLLREWLEDPNLIGWGYCQDGRTYMPVDALIPEGGYEVDAANAYGKLGPARFKVGMNEATRETFLKLKARIEAS